MDTSSRPWQGTALAVIDIIGTVFAFLGGKLHSYFYKE